MKNLSLFLLLFLPVGVFSEIEVLKKRKNSVGELPPHESAVSVSEEVKQEKKNPQSVDSNPSKNVSVRRTNHKGESSSQRRPTAQGSPLPLKRELVGEDYYQTVDSAVIQQEINEHLRAIEKLCDIEDSAKKIREWNKRTQALTQLADRYVDERRLYAEDEYLLRSLRFYTSPGRLSYGQEITQELLNEINLYEEFKVQYYADRGLHSEISIEELPDEWAQKIAKGLSCF